MAKQCVRLLQHIDHIMESHGTQIMQAVILILEGDHSADVKEQALCILANIADGDTAKAFIMSNEDVLKKLTTYIVSGQGQAEPVFEPGPKPHLSRRPTPTSSSR